MTSGPGISPSLCSAVGLIGFIMTTGRKMDAAAPASHPISPRPQPTSPWLCVSVPEPIAELPGSDPVTSPLLHPGAGIPPSDLECDSGG